LGSGKPARRKSHSEFVIKNDEMSAGTLDVRTYQIRELYGAASEAKVTTCSDAFVLIDEDGKGSISNGALEHYLEQTVPVCG
jgi:hypothetical protein